MTRRECFSVSRYAAVVQRSIITPSRQRGTGRVRSSVARLAHSGAVRSVRLGDSSLPPPKDKQESNRKHKIEQILAPKTDRLSN